MTLTKSDLQEISKIIKNETDPLAAELKEVKTRVKKIKNNVENMLGYLDTQDVRLEKRVAKIEKHLNLPQN